MFKPMKGETDGEYITIRIEEMRNALVGKPQGKNPLGRYRRRWEYNIKMGLKNRT
jgi:hypothetical protein